jgi:hypothetical protein
MSVDNVRILLGLHQHLRLVKIYVSDFHLAASETMHHAQHARYLTRTPHAPPRAAARSGDNLRNSVRAGALVSARWQQHRGASPASAARHRHTTR